MHRSQARYASENNRHLTRTSDGRVVSMATTSAPNVNNATSQTTDITLPTYGVTLPSTWSSPDSLHAPNPPSAASLNSGTSAYKVWTSASLASYFTTLTSASSDYSSYYAPLPTNIDPVWSPNEQFIIFASNRTSVSISTPTSLYHLFAISASGYASGDSSTLVQVTGLSGEPGIGTSQRWPAFVGTSSTEIVYCDQKTGAASGATAYSHIVNAYLSTSAGYPVIPAGKYSTITTIATSSSSGSVEPNSDFYVQHAVASTSIVVFAGATSANGPYHLYYGNLSGGVVTQITYDAGGAGTNGTSEYDPVLSPKGDLIAFDSNVTPGASAWSYANSKLSTNAAATTGARQVYVTNQTGTLISQLTSAANSYSNITPAWSLTSANSTLNVSANRQYLFFARQASSGSPFGISYLRADETSPGLTVTAALPSNCASSPATAAILDCEGQNNSQASENYTSDSGGWVKLITLTNVTGGTYTLTFGGQTTGAIAYNATAATVQTALAALSTIGTGNVAVTGNAGGPYTITFPNSLYTVVGSMTLTGSLTGANRTVSLTSAFYGVNGATQVDTSQPSDANDPATAGTIPPSSHYQYDCIQPSVSTMQTYPMVAYSTARFVSDDTILNGASLGDTNPIEFMTGSASASFTAISGSWTDNESDSEPTSANALASSDSLPYDLIAGATYASGSSTLGSLNHEVATSQIADVSPPSLLRFSDTTAEIFRIEDTTKQGVATKYIGAGGQVSIVARLSDRQSGVRAVYLQMKDPDSKYQDAAGLEHKVFSHTQASLAGGTNQRATIGEDDEATLLSPANGYLGGNGTGYSGPLYDGAGVNAAEPIMLANAYVTQPNANTEYLGNDRVTQGTVATGSTTLPVAGDGYGAFRPGDTITITQGGGSFTTLVVSVDYTTDTGTTPTATITLYDPIPSGTVIPAFINGLGFYANSNPAAGGTAATVPTATITRNYQRVFDFTGNEIDCQALNIYNATVTDGVAEVSRTAMRPPANTTRGYILGGPTTSSFDTAGTVDLAGTGSEGTTYAFDSSSPYNYVTPRWAPGKSDNTNWGGYDGNEPNFNVKSQAYWIPMWPLQTTTTTTCTPGLAGSSISLTVSGITGFEPGDIVVLKDNGSGGTNEFVELQISSSFDASTAYNSTTSTGVIPATVVNTGTSGGGLFQSGATLYEKQSAGGGVKFMTTLTTPSTGSDFYLDLIAFDNSYYPAPYNVEDAANATLSSTNRLYNWRIYDNVDGFTTQAFSQVNGILVVNDHALPQKFFGGTFGANNTRNIPQLVYGAESYITDIDTSFNDATYTNKTLYNSNGLSPNGYTDEVGNKITLRPPACLPDWAINYALGTGKPPFVTPIVDTSNDGFATVANPAAAAANNIYGPGYANGLGVNSYVDYPQSPSGSHQTSVQYVTRNANPALYTNSNYEEIDQNSSPLAPSQKYDIWRVLSRGPITDAVLNAYAPRVQQQPPVPGDANNPDQNYNNVVVADKCVLWLSPFTGDQYVENGGLSDSSTQTSLLNFLAEGGRLMVTGQDVGYALTGGSTTASDTLYNTYLGASYTSDVSPNAATLDYQAKMSANAFDYLSNDAWPNYKHSGFYVSNGNVGGTVTYTYTAPSAIGTYVSNNYNADYEGAFTDFSDGSPNTYLRATSNTNNLIDQFSLVSTTNSHQELQGDNGSVNNGVIFTGDPLAGYLGTGTDPSSAYITVYGSFGFETISQNVSLLGTGAHAYSFYSNNQRTNLLHNLVCFLRTGKITGTVLVNNTGSQPIQGATVSAKMSGGVTGPSGLSSTKMSFTGTSDSSGNFEIDGLPTGSWDITATAKIGTLNTYNHQTDLDVELHGGDSRSLTFSIDEPTVTATVKVTDTYGNAISGANVILTESDGANTNPNTYSAATDVTGVATMSGVVPGTYQVDIPTSNSSAANYNTVTINNTTYVGYHSSTLNTPTYVAISPSGYCFFANTPAPTAADLAAATFSTMPIPITMWQAPLSDFQVEIEDEDDGTFKTGVTVTLTNTQTTLVGPYTATTTGSTPYPADFSGTIAVVPGTYNITLPNLTSTFNLVVDSSVNLNNFTIASTTTSPLVIKVHRPLTVFVYNSTNNTGLANAAVTLTLLDSSGKATTTTYTGTTDATGYATISGAPLTGSFNVTATGLAAYAQLVNTTQPSPYAITLAGNGSNYYLGTAASGTELALPLPIALVPILTVPILVEDSVSSNPIAGATVSLIDTSVTPAVTYPSGGATTAATGIASIASVPKGDTFQITASATNYASFTSNATSTPATQVISTNGQITVKLAPTFTFKAYVFDESNSTGVGAAVVTLTATDGSATFMQTTSTTSLGYATFANLPAGTYNIAITATGYTMDPADTVSAVSITGAETLNFAMRVGVTTPVTFNVSNKDTAALLSNAVISLGGTGAPATYSGNTSSGVLALSSVEVGTYTLTVSLANYKTYTATVTISTSTSTLFIALQPLLVATVQLLDANNNYAGIAGGNVTMTGSDGTVYTGTPDSTVTGLYDFGTSSTPLIPSDDTYTVNVTNALTIGYQTPATVTQYVNSSTAFPISIYMQELVPSAVISLYDEKQLAFPPNALTGATVTLTESDGLGTNFYTGTADTVNGKYDFSNVASGKYNIGVSLPGYSEDPSTTYPVTGVTISQALPNHTVAMTNPVSTASVVVNVTDSATGSGITGAIVTLTAATGISYSGETTSGQVTLTGVTMATAYTVSISSNGMGYVGFTPVAYTLPTLPTGTTSVTLNYTLTPYVSVYVYNASTNAALPGATITIAPTAGGTNYTGTTATTGYPGYATVTGVPFGATYNITASLAGYGSVTLSSKSIAASAGNYSFSIGLTQVGTVTITVKNLDSGATISGASVFLSGADGTTYPSTGSVLTNASGIATISNVPVGSSYSLYASATGYKSGSSSPISVTTSANATILLSPLYSAQVKVTNSSGAPVNGAVVTLWELNSSGKVDGVTYSAVSGAGGYNGYATLTNVPYLGAASSYSYALEVIDVPSYAPYYITSSTTPALPAITSTTPTIGVTLTSTATVTAQVVDSATSDGISGATVTLTPSSTATTSASDLTTPSALSATTNSSGIATFTYVVPSTYTGSPYTNLTYTVATTPSYHTSATRTVTINSDGSTYTDTSTSTTASYPITLSVSSTVTFVVKDGSTALTDATVTVTPPNDTVGGANDIVAKYSSSVGAYVANIPGVSGTYTVTVADAGYLTDSSTFSLTTSSYTGTVSLVESEIEGTVTNSATSLVSGPISGATATVTTTTGTLTGTTDASGIFVLSSAPAGGRILAGATYTVTITASGYATNTTASATIRPAPTSNSGTANTDGTGPENINYTAPPTIAISPGNQNVNVTVVDGSTVLTDSTTTVTVTDPNGAGHKAALTSGVYVASVPVLAGTYTILVDNTAGYLTDTETIPNMFATVGTPYSKTVTLIPSEIIGTVTNASTSPLAGQAVSGATVSLLTAASPTALTATTDSSGSFVLKSLPAGGRIAASVTYSAANSDALTVTATNYTSATASVTTVSSPTSTNEAPNTYTPTGSTTTVGQNINYPTPNPITLTPASQTVTVTVKDGSTALSDATVTITPPGATFGGTSDIQATPSTTAGSYVATVPVVSGTYTVTVGDTGYLTDTSTFTYTTLSTPITHAVSLVELGMVVTVESTSGTPISGVKLVLSSTSTSVTTRTVTTGSTGVVSFYSGATTASRLPKNTLFTLTATPLTPYAAASKSVTLTDIGSTNGVANTSTTTPNPLPVTLKLSAATTATVFGLVSCPTTLYSASHAVPATQAATVTLASTDDLGNAITYSTTTTAATTGPDGSASNYSITVPLTGSQNGTAPAAYTVTVTDPYYVGNSPLTASTGLTVTGATRQDATLTPVYNFATVANPNYPASSSNPYTMQMLSEPYDFTDGLSLSDRFGANLVSGQKIAWWDGYSQSWVFPTTLTRGEAFWIRLQNLNSLTSYSAASIALLGTYTKISSETSPAQITLYEGWNMIGSPWDKSVTASSGFTVSDLYGTIHTWSDAIGTSNLVSPTFYTFPGSSPDYTTVDMTSGTLAPWVGYWVYAYTYCKLLVKSP
ncbi:MAG: carboxypeptidase regulatory-like domain-containing protein [Capsulimonadaceae bacterium]|nr:carboxypeptidase regulatory-like domain-containing protein [Capsulimonadaceae bacterium]